MLAWYACWCHLCHLQAMDEQVLASQECVVAVWCAQLHMVLSCSQDSPPHLTHVKVHISSHTMRSTTHYSPLWMT